MALEPGKKGWKTKKEMRKVGGEKGKLHRELGIPEGEKIPQSRLRAAASSDKPEVARDAKRAETMEGWSKSRHQRMYKHPRSRRND